MLKTVRNAFKVEDIRKRLLYTLLMLVVVRFGSQLPTPGVDPTFIQNFFAQQTGDAFNFFEAFTGGSFTRMSVFALSITPYITSSIIMQLLTIAIPKLEEMQKDGEDGRKKIAAITRYVTVGLALIESIAMSIGFGRQGLLVDYNFVNCAIVVCTLTAGSAFLMWIGERITEKGVGNGISIVLLINIISRVPDDLVTLYTQFMSGKKLAKAGLAGIIILAILLVVIVFVIILQDGERRIAVQYSKKVQGRKTYGGQSSHIPLKVNTAGVIPVIFSSSLMQTPIVIAQFLGKGNDAVVKLQLVDGDVVERVRGGHDSRRPLRLILELDFQAVNVCITFRRRPCCRRGRSVAHPVGVGARQSDVDRRINLRSRGSLIVCEVNVTIELHGFVAILVDGRFRSVQMRASRTGSSVRRSATATLRSILPTVTATEKAGVWRSTPPASSIPVPSLT